MTKTWNREQEQAGAEHGISEAFYTWMGGELAPHLKCLCGAVFSGETWKEAGARLDEHLARWADVAGKLVTP